MANKRNKMAIDYDTFKSRATIALYGSLLVLFLVMLLFLALIPDEILGISKNFIMVSTLVIGWFFILLKVLPRCPNCGMGVYSLIEYKRVPIFVKSWISKRCSGCGVAYEDSLKNAE